jgi:quinol monooxygenase YgiN
MRPPPKSTGGDVLVVRFRVVSKPDRAEELRSAFEAIVASSREVDGVVHFDIGRDVTDANAFIATEVFEDASALQRQEAQEQVQAVMALLPDVVAAPPEATIFEVASSRPWGS